MQYRADLADYNLNTNQQATAVTDFTTTRANKTYTVGLIALSFEKFALIGARSFVATDSIKFLAKSSKLERASHIYHPARQVRRRRPIQ